MQMRMLYVAFTVLAIVASALGVIATIQLRRSAALSDQLLSRDMEDLSMVQALALDNERAARKARSYLLSGEARFINEWVLILKRVERRLSLLEDRVNTPVGSQLLASVEAALADAQVEMRLAMEARARGDIAGASARLLRDVQPVRDRLDVGVAELTAHFERRLAEDRGVFRQARQDAFAFVTAGLAVTVLLSLVLVANLTREYRDHKKLEQFETQLLTIVGHDIRSPLTAIAMSSSFLARAEELPHDLRGAVLRISRSAERIQKLIGALLDFVRTHTVRRLPLVIESVNLHEVGARVMEEMRALYPHRLFTCEAQGNISGKWDSARLEQLTLNLVENAVFHGATEHPVRLSYWDEGGWVAFEVHNWGKPIPPQVLESLFEPLHGTASPDRPVRASRGLGLYIVKEVVESHQGQITVHSSEGEGTRFIVRLPRAVQLASEPPRPKPPREPGMPVHMH